MSVRFAYRVLSLVVLISLAIQPLAVMGRQVDEETNVVKLGLLLRAQSV
jgi:hypothetical protein